MTISDVEICNMALLKFGDIQITALTDDSREARTCNTIYPILKDQLLYSYPWNFAVVRADITPEITSTPPFEWDYAYTLPYDSLRVLALFGSAAKWVVNNGLFLTNQNNNIFIKYISQVDAPGRFNPYFSSCLSLLLAAELATKLKGSKSMRNNLLNELMKIELPKAYRLNAIEGNRVLSSGETPLDQNNFTWQNTGYGIQTDLNIYES